MQREVLLEEGLKSLDLDLEQRSNVTGHQGNHLVTLRGKDEQRASKWAFPQSLKLSYLESFPILGAPLQR